MKAKEPPARRPGDDDDIDSRDFSMADFAELPDKDIFAKTYPFTDFMDDLLDRGHNTYSRTLTGPSAHRVTIRDTRTGEQREMIMMASNNYLGLTTHPRVVEAGRKALEKYGIGAGGVPLLSGYLDLQAELESSLARVKACEDAVVFSSGYSSNVGTISALLRRGDVAIQDRLNHASLIDGCRFSGVDLRTFKHNDMEALDRLLATCGEKYMGKLVVTDGVFSMDGDITPLPELLEVSHRHGARVMIDEAHATGVVGANGRGTAEHWGVEGKVDIVAGTLSKALGAVGGYVCSSKSVIRFIRFYARSNMFSTALPPTVLASLIEGLKVIEEEPQLREQLRKNIGYMHRNLRRLGFNIGNTETAIIPVIIGDDIVLREMGRRLHEEGVFANAVPYPAVPKRLCRIRLSLMATHTPADLDLTLSALEKVGREFGVI